MPATAVGSAKGKIDQRIDEALAGKAIAHQRPGDEQPEDAIDDRGNRGGAERKLQRGKHARLWSPHR